MSSTSQYTDWSDLYTGLQQLLNVTTGITATENIAKRLIDAANHDIMVAHGEKLSWYERRAFLTTHPQYTTGTVTATEGSTTLTGSSTAWNTSDGIHNNMRVGGKVSISGSYTVYTVTAVASDTSATISPAYIGDTDSGLSYTYFEDEYALDSAFFKPIDQRKFDDRCMIELVGRSDFRRLAPRNSTPTTYPQIANIIDLAFSGNTTPIRKIALAPPPATRQVIPYTFVTRNIVVATDGTEKQSFTATTDEPIIPKPYRHAIVLKAAEQWYRDKKDDIQRASLIGAEYRELIARMIADNDIGAQRARIVPNVAGYAARAARPWRGSSRRFDADGRFGRLED